MEIPGDQKFYVTYFLPGSLETQAYTRRWGHLGTCCKIMQLDNQKGHKIGPFAYQSLKLLVYEQ